MKNLHFPNGTSIIPKGSFVYISTDDPDGLCVNCFVQRKACTEYTTPKPPGCPEDVSLSLEKCFLCLNLNVFYVNFY